MIKGESYITDKLDMAFQMQSLHWTCSTCHNLSAGNSRCCCIVQETGQSLSRRGRACCTDGLNLFGHCCSQALDSRDFLNSRSQKKKNWNKKSSYSRELWRNCTSKPVQIHHNCTKNSQRIFHLWSVVPLCVGTIFEMCVMRPCAGHRGPTHNTIPAQPP